MSAQEQKQALTACVSRLTSLIEDCEDAIAQRRDRIEGNAVAVSARSTAAALGDDFKGTVLSPAEIAVLEQEVEGYEVALKQLTAQRKSGQLNLQRVELALREEQAAYLRHEVVPPLLESAQEAGAVFGRALAALAAAEDEALKLRRPAGEPYIPGNASRFVDGVNAGRGDNVFFDVGPGRGVWDLPDYHPQRAKITAQLREVYP